MGRHYKPRLIPEQNQRICGSICFCQLTMVLSCVALVYLTVAIYVPSHRAFKSGIDPIPVMCMTINTTMAKNCQWASCGEWCLTKTSGFCPQIHVTVMRNGTGIRLINCTSNLTTCPPANLGALKKFNCNQGTECSHMNGVYNCTLGHCTNMSELYQCEPKIDGGSVIDSERDNLKLNGHFVCNKSSCIKIKQSFECDRRCPENIPTRGKNVYLKYGDSVVASTCHAAYSLHEANGTEPGKAINATRFWSKEDKTVLFATCLDVVPSAGRQLNATDCVNGTLIDPALIPNKDNGMNYTVFYELYNSSLNRPADPLHRYVPMQSEITIYNNSRLYINLEACVNTLQGECKQFLDTHGRDGDNRTAPSRFPCYYDKNDPFFVVARFDLKKTLRELIIAVAVPSALFVVSWATLCFITRSVNVGDDAKLRCKYCTDGGDESELREEETTMITSHSDPQYVPIARENRALAESA
ncbi:uncharacterized protein Teh4 [Anabrus simplex]|uniref:uncharacterized protein Teh4 n=1 Tax=Anabrus simplex TaxID=316456 RepID=UPI0035A32365